MIDEKKLIEEIRQEQRGLLRESEKDNFACEVLEQVIRIVNEQPKADWIPCEERLPKSEDKYGWVKCNVTVMRSHFPTSTYDLCDAPYDEYFVTNAMYDVTQKIWHLDEMTQLNALIDIDDSPLNGDYVIAWQPLPQPYKKEG